MTMDLRRLIGQLVSSFLLLNIVRGYKSRASAMKINAARAYVLGVKKTRLIFLGALFALISFIFLINGLSLIQEAIFTYSMWSREMKFVAALSLGGIELLGAVGFLVYLFREETWCRVFAVGKVVNLAVTPEGRGTKP
jgi:hypothetical protein